MSRTAGTLALFAAMAALLSQGCDTSTPSGPDAVRQAPSETGLESRQVSLPFNASNFVSVITNRYNPMIPGTIFHYRSQTRDGVETSEFRITRNTKKILGVTATVVHDRVFLDGELTEDTFDWFAQDAQGNVWYLGEDSKEIDHGQVVSTEGSWEAGVNGAQPGIIMLAQPQTGLAYRQEFAAGVAEDNAKVLSLKAAVDVPFRSFDGCLRTLEWTPLDPGAREHKFYCPGVGLVLTAQPKGGNIKDELVSITHF
jgi:hypothetical protein